MLSGGELGGDVAGEPASTTTTAAAAAVSSLWFNSSTSLRFSSLSEPSLTATVANSSSSESSLSSASFPTFLDVPCFHLSFPFQQKPKKDIPIRLLSLLSRPSQDVISYSGSFIALHIKRDPPSKKPFLNRRPRDHNHPNSINTVPLYVCPTYIYSLGPFVSNDVPRTNSKGTSNVDSHQVDTRAMRFWKGRPAKAFEVLSLDRPAAILLLSALR